MTTSKTPDTIKVEVIAGNGIRAGSIDAFTTIQITNDITMPSEASFELGDDGTFNALGDIFQPGVAFQVFVNDRPRLRGRVEMLDSPFDTGAGAVTRFTVRTKLSDAMVASADQGIKVKGTSLKEFILKLYEPLGFFEDKFEFDQTAAVNLITGKAKGDRDRPLDLERIKVKAARVRPPETIYAAADKHLRRHGLMHWDSPNGKIVVGLPNDTQSPSFKLNMFKDSRSDGNNILSGTRTRDWSGVPSSVNVFGRGGKRGFTSKSIASRFRNSKGFLKTSACVSSASNSKIQRPSELINPSSRKRSR